MAKYSQEFKLKVVEYYYSGHGDATGKLQHLRFCESESTFDYMISTRLYVEQHGKPLAFYSDKHSVFRVNQCRCRQDRADRSFTSCPGHADDHHSRLPGHGRWHGQAGR